MRKRFRVGLTPAPGERIALDERASHHLIDVLRVPRGESIELFDGAGRRWAATLVDVRDGVAFAEIAAASAAPRDAPSRELVLAQTRKPAWELALRMATELGATRILPFVAQRSVALEDHNERWQRILESAAQQCGRADLPQILPGAPLKQQLQSCDSQHRLMLSPGAPCIDPPDSGGVALLIGPEGGLTEHEQSLARDVGFAAVGLGQWTLRADTAVVAALARYGLPTPRSTR